MWNLLKTELRALGRALARLDAQAVTVLIFAGIVVFGALVTLWDPISNRIWAVRITAGVTLLAAVVWLLF